jgi:hypothetical protein
MTNLFRRIADIFRSTPAPPMRTDAEREPIEPTLPVQTGAGIVPPVAPPPAPGDDKPEH